MSTPQGFGGLRVDGNDEVYSTGRGDMVDKITMVSDVPSWG